MAKLGSLFVSLIVDTAQFSSGLDRSRAQMSSWGAAMNRGLAQVDKSWQGLTKSMLAVTGGMFSLKGAAGALIGVGAGSGLVAMAKQAVDAVGGLGELAQQLGVSTDTLQAFRFAATQTGLSTEEMEAGIARLTRSIGEAVNGSKPAIEAFQQLGVKFTDNEGKARSTEAVMRDVADAYARAGDQVKAGAALNDLFGKSFQRMLPFLGDGARGIDNLISKARELGVVLDAETIKRADDASDKLATLSLVLTTNFQGALVELAPVLAATSDAFLGFSRDVRALVDTFTSLDNLSVDALTEKLTTLQKKRDELTQDLGKARSLLPEASVDFGSDSLWGWLTGSRTEEPLRIGTLEKQLGDVNAEITQIQAIIRRRRDAQDQLRNAGSGTGGGDTETTIKAETAALKEQTSALDELLQSMTLEAQLSRLTNRERQISEALIRANAAAQRDYDAGLRDSPLIDPETAERIRETTGALFDQAQAQAAALKTTETAIDDTAEATLNLDNYATQLGATFTSAFEDAVIAGDSLHDVLMGLLQDLERIALRLGAEEIAGNLFSKAIGWLGGLFSGGGGLGSVGAPLNTGGSSWMFHSGGVVGVDGRRRSVPALAFAGAPRLHGGGFIGPGEVPAILQRGEGVFTAAQMAAMGDRGGDTAVTNITVNVAGTGGTPAQNREQGEEIAKSIERAMDERIDRRLAHHARTGNMMNRGRGF